MSRLPLCVIGDRRMCWFERDGCALTQAQCQSPDGGKFRHEFAFVFCFSTFYYSELMSFWQEMDFVGGYGASRNFFYVTML